MVNRDLRAGALAIALLGCAALSCSNGSGGGKPPVAGGSGLSIPNGPMPIDAGMPPVITQIPIPPDCQSPGFPGGDQHVDTASIEAQLSAAKPMVEQRQQDLLNLRYDLSDNPSPTVFMTRGKPIQIGVRVKLPDGETWDSLNAMTSEEILAGDFLPPGFYPLPHPNHQLGGMLFTHLLIDELNAQTGNFRNQTRFDLDFDLPDHILPEFPPAMFLTNHTDLGDVSQGQMVTIENYYDMFKNILDPEELEGLRLLVTPFPQQEFNLIDDRRTHRPNMGVACFDCHANGHTTGSIEILPDDRPQPERRRGDTPSLRGLANDQIFGSKRAIETVEDFSSFEERTAYFDGDITQPKKKGETFLDEMPQLQGMAEVQRLLDFPPAPKLNLLGQLDHSKATEAEIRGEAVFNGKGLCGACHPAPYYFDNELHDLHMERFYVPKLINCRLAEPEGPIKTFTLRGIKESPPYLHDGRLLTLEDTIEFFNLVLGTQLTAGEKADLLAFLYVL